MCSNKFTPEFCFIAKRLQIKTLEKQLHIEALRGQWQWINSTSRWLKSAGFFCVFLCTQVTCVHMCLWICSECTFVDQMCQCAGEVDEKLPQSEVPCGQHSGRARTKSNLCVPALETQPQHERRKQWTAKERISLTQLRAFAKIWIKNQISKRLQQLSLCLNKTKMVRKCVFVLDCFPGFQIIFFP